MNVPVASHLGGVWERQIRSVRNVMAHPLHVHRGQLDESLRTFLCEASTIVNSRPLSAETINNLCQTFHWANIFFSQWNPTSFCLHQEIFKDLTRTVVNLGVVRTI